jgi:uncharacterized iron-regulated protein
MKIIRPFVLLALIVCLFISADKPAYIIYTADGKTADYDKMLKEALNADVILFGELHDNPVVHWLELELTKSIYSVKKDQLLLGAEMFECDDQIKLDEFLKGTITEKNFEEEIKKWSNYKTDYKPLLLFAKENKLAMIATNVPRRYASYVSAHGLDSLSYLNDIEKKYFPPLPVSYQPELSCYKNISSMTMGHKSAHLAEAQAIKDATMSYHILENYSKGKIFIHFNGAYHSNNFEGIMWYLKNANKNLKIMTISSVEQSDITKLDDENKKLADFIIVVDEDMTKTN